MATHKKIFLLLSFLIVSLTAFSQENRFLRMETNIAQAFLDEHNLSLTYRNSDNFGLYMSVGYKFYNKILCGIGLDGLSPTQWDYPILKYNGPTFRMGYFYSHFHTSREKSNPRLFYLKIGFVYKNIGYNNFRFFDMPDGYTSDYWFTRSERALVYGGDLIFGKTIYLIDDKFFYVGWHFGTGFRYKIRDFTVTDCSGSLCNCCDKGVGTFHDIQSYPVFIFGISIGINVQNFPNDKE